MSSVLQILTTNYIGQQSEITHTDCYGNVIVLFMFSI
jgi:hypothetical protein